MGAKKIQRRAKSSKFDSFNRSQQIYKLLEKGIIESEALSSSAADRPEDDAHVLELLEGSGEGAQAGAQGRSGAKKAKGGAPKRSMLRPKALKRKRR
jgi:hypothetical protein